MILRKTIWLRGGASVYRRFPTSLWSVEDRSNWVDRGYSSLSAYIADSFAFSIHKVESTYL
jgi:hypothetical protein